MVKINVKEELKMLIARPEHPKSKSWKIEERMQKIEYHGRVVNYKKLLDIYRILKRTRVDEVKVNAESGSLRIWSDTPSVMYNLI